MWVCYLSLFWRKDEEFQGVGLTYGGSIGFGIKTPRSRIGLDLGFGTDEKVYDFATTNRKFSLNLHYQPL